jgi:hypothetical protein
VSNDASLRDKISACISLAQFSADMLKSRREVEWKVTVALWTLIAASAAFLVSNKIALPFFWVPVIVILHYIWLRRMNHSFQVDQRKAYHFREQAEFCLLSNDHGIQPSPPRIAHHSREWWFGVLINVRVYSNFSQLSDWQSLPTSLAKGHTNSALPRFG